MRTSPSEGRTVVQALADGIKGLFRVLEDVEEGRDAAESVAREAKRLLSKKSVRRLRGKVASPKKTKPKKLPREPAIIDVEGHETH